MLWMDYYFYLSKLPEEERRNQILLLTEFFKRNSTIKIYIIK